MLYIKCCEEGNERITCRMRELGNTEGRGKLKIQKERDIERSKRKLKK